MEHLQLAACNAWPRTGLQYIVYSQTLVKQSLILSFSWDKKIKTASTASYLLSAGSTE